MGNQEQEQEAIIIEKHKKNMKFERQLLEQKPEFEKQRDEERAAAQKAEQLQLFSAAKFNGKKKSGFLSGAGLCPKLI